MTAATPRTPLRVGSRPTLALTLSLTCALLACRTDLSVPDGAQLLCTSDADCPAGSFCRPALGRCMRTAGADDAAPSVVSTSVLPASAGPSTDVTATFTVDDDL